MAAAAAADKIPVFIHTNLQTQLAMAVSPDIIAGDLKREFRREHSICFSKVGEIRIIGLMVKRKSYFYRLPNSMAIKNVFRDRKGVWFLSIDAELVSNSGNHCLSNGLAAEFGVSDCNGTNVRKSENAENLMETKKKPKKMKRKKSWDLKQEQISQPTVETPSLSSSERVSVTDIISRYFPESEEAKSADGHFGGVISDEFESHICNKRHLGMSSRAKRIKQSKKVLVHPTPQTTRTPSRLLSFPVPVESSVKTSRRRFGRMEVGNRLVVAAKDLII